MHEPIAYFEHGADIGIVGRGERIEEAFEHAAAAMFAIMADPGQISPQAASPSNSRKPMRSSRWSPGSINCWARREAED